MLTVDEALRAVMERVSPLPARRVPLARALGLVLAEEIRADLDLPPFDKALVDGYAVRSEDLIGPGPHRLTIGEEILAGRTPTFPVFHGQAAVIMTGAPIPEGADAVVMVEETRRENGEVIVERSVSPGQFRLERGREMKAGDVLLRPGAILSPARLGLLASVGCVSPLVVRRPIMSIVPTGDELVAPDKRPGPGQIRNSNAAMLCALALESGVEATEHPIAPDDPDPLRRILDGASDSDILLITGGVSAGNRDLVPEVLESLGVVRVFHKVRVRPGKPIWFGVSPPRPDGASGLVFGLPGNPVSGAVGFHLFVRPALARLAGRDAVALKPVRGPLRAGFVHRGERPTYHPAVRDEDGAIETLAWAGSSDLRTVADAEGFAIFPAGDRQYVAGESIEFLPITPPGNWF
jgi:molybdopterin molybdotransferase